MGFGVGLEGVDVLGGAGFGVAVLGAAGLGGVGFALGDIVTFLLTPPDGAGVFGLGCTADGVDDPVSCFRASAAEMVLLGAAFLGVGFLGAGFLGAGAPPPTMFLTPPSAPVAAAEAFDTAAVALERYVDVPAFRP